MHASKIISRTMGLALASTALITLGAGEAAAGGFAVREQSSSFMGSSFAGNAAGGDLSSMYWNSAAVGMTDGTNFESHYALILPDAQMTSQAGSTPTLPNIGASTDFGNWAIVGSSYAGHQLTPNISVGMAVNSPYGLVTEPEDTNWTGQYHNRTSKLFTLTANPVASIKFGEAFILGAGAQINYSKVTLKTNPSFALPNQNSSHLNADDYGFGFTVGGIVMPMEGTRLGIGYRSKVSLNLEGNASVSRNQAGVAFLGGAVVNAGFDSVEAHADLPLPEILTVSLVQDITPSIRALATFEWTNWSQLGSVPIVAQSDGGVKGIPAPVGPLAPFAPGRTINTLEFNWDDGFFYSLGGEFDVNDRWTLRTGVAWEESPIDNATQRSTAVPDSDRTWLSFGGTFDYNERTTIDFGYTHIWFADGPIARTAAVAPLLAGHGVGATDVTYIGEAEQSADIIAFSFKRKLDGSGLLGGLF